MTPSAYNDTSAYAARRDPRRGESPMMCASTVQVAALPGEVVSNTGKQNYCQRTEGRSRLGTYVCSSDLWERPSVFFDSRDMGIGHSLLSTSFSRYLKHPPFFHCPHTPQLQGFLIGSHISAIKSSTGKRGIMMENIDLCGVIQLLRSLVAQKKATEKEARKILSRIAAQTGASIVISF